MLHFNTSVVDLANHRQKNTHKKNMDRLEPSGLTSDQGGQYLAGDLYFQQIQSTNMFAVLFFQMLIGWSNSWVAKRSFELNFHCMFQTLSPC